jgi:hypothetical protein
LVINSISCSIKCDKAKAPTSDQERLLTKASIADKTMQLKFDIFAANGLILLVLQARSSVGERFLDTEEVGSSILPVPTIF